MRKNENDKVFKTFIDKICAIQLILKITATLFYFPLRTKTCRLSDSLSYVILIITSDSLTKDFYLGYSLSILVELPAACFFCILVSRLVVGSFLHRTRYSISGGRDCCFFSICCVYIILINCLLLLRQEILKRANFA